MVAVIETWEAEPALPVLSELGEGPWWDAGRGRLLWVDITAGLVRSYVPATGDTRTVGLNDPVGFVVGRTDGGYLGGTARGLVALDSELRATGVVAAPSDLHGARRINDGTCDPVGRVLFGTVDPTGESAGTLWSCSRDGTLVALVDRVAMSNGLAFSPDAGTLYYVDSPTRRVDAFSYDVDAGTVADRRTLYVVPDAAGLPDGLAVDVEGCVWVAIWGAGEVRRISPEGRHIATVRVPATAACSCAFGGDSRERLFVTTARGAGSEAREPLAGAVFAVETGITGSRVWSAAVGARGDDTKAGR